MTVFLALLGGILLSPPAHAKAAGTPLTLRLVAAKAGVVAGEPVTLRAVVTNRTGAACRLAAVSDGTVQITSVTRDGKPVRPGFFQVGYDDSYAGRLTANLREALPGKSVSFPLTEHSRLTSVTPTPTGNGVGASWGLDKPGEYAITAAYRMPFVDGGCVGSSGTATVKYTATPPHVAPARNWWLIGAAIALGALVVALAIVLVRRRRTGAAVVLVLLAAATLPAVGQTEPGYAKITIDPLPAGFSGAVDGCLGQLRKHDPAGIMKDLDASKYNVAIYHTTGQGNVKAHTYPDHAEISWDHQDTSPYQGDVGPAYDPCPALYHELVHAYDREHRQLFPSPCPAGTPGRRPSISDVRAIRAENAVRAEIGTSDAGKLPRRSAGRNSRGSMPLPPGDKSDIDSVLKDCKTDRKRTPPNNKGAIGSGLLGGGSDGDPHLTTFDQRRYDFQAVGEFVLARSGDLQVQVRQAAVKDSRLVSVNSALGLRVGPDRLSFAQHPDGLQIALNGKPTAFRDTKTTLPGGGTVAPHDFEHTVTWPDGTRAEIFPIGLWGLRILLYPAKQRKGTFTGLLGDFDGDPHNDLVTTGGRQLPQAPTHKQLYGHGGFADRWRVSQADSLLPYPKGTDTRSYTDKTFPDKPTTDAGPSSEARRAAREICTALGIVERARLRDCILDVALTGQAAFAATAVITDQLTSAALPAASGKPAGERVKPGGTLRDGSLADASIDTGGDAHTYRLQLGDATVFRLYDITGEDGRGQSGSLRIDLDGPDASGSPGFTVTSNYQYRVRNGGIYTLTVSRVNNDTGRYGFRLVTAKERRIDAAIGDKIIGRLDVPGRIDLYVLTATRKTDLYLAGGAGCELEAAIVEDSPAPRVYTPSRPCWEITLVAAEPGKQYLLIVWSPDGGTGDYSFRIATR